MIISMNEYPIKEKYMKGILKKRRNIPVNLRKKRDGRTKINHNLGTNLIINRSEKHTTKTFQSLKKYRSVEFIVAF